MTEGLQPEGRFHWIAEASKFVAVGIPVQIALELALLVVYQKLGLTQGLDPRGVLAVVTAVSTYPAIGITNTLLGRNQIRPPEEPPTQV